MSIKITNDNYSTYKKVAEILFRHTWKSFENKLPPEVHPMAVLNSWELKSKSLAKRGLQSGLNDVLSSINQFPKEMLSEISTELEREGLPDVNSLINIIPKTINKVLLSKKIKNLDQYYIIKEIIDDTTSEIYNGDRILLTGYMSEFELKQHRK